MCLRIQTSDFVTIYDYAPYLEQKINEGLTALHKGEAPEFPLYSLLMHLILYHNMAHFRLFMTLEIERDGEVLPVQLWPTMVRCMILVLFCLRIDLEEH